MESNLTGADLESVYSISLGEEYLPLELNEANEDTRYVEYKIETPLEEGAELTFKENAFAIENIGPDGSYVEEELVLSEGNNLVLNEEKWVVKEANPEGAVYLKVWADGGHSYYVTSPKSEEPEPEGQPCHIHRNGMDDCDLRAQDIPECVNSFHDMACRRRSALYHRCDYLWQKGIQIPPLGLAFVHQSRRYMPFHQFRLLFTRLNTIQFGNLVLILWQISTKKQ